MNSLLKNCFENWMDLLQVLNLHWIHWEIISNKDLDFRCLPLVKFSPILGKVVEVSSSIKRDLSTDQKYLYEMCLGVQSGVNFFQGCQVHIRQQGRLHNARWFTLANRIMRFYISQVEPTSELIRIVSFIINSNDPCYFK